MAGAIAAAFTVNVAMLEVTVPTLLLTSQRYWLPLMASVVALVV